MKHKEVWTEIAEAYLTPASDGSKRQREIAHLGLCFAAEEGGLYGFGSFFRRARTPKLGACGYWLPTRFRGCSRELGKHHRQHDLMRGDLATLMSCMTKKEFNELLAK